MKTNKDYILEAARKRGQTPAELKLIGDYLDTLTFEQEEVLDDIFVYRETLYWTAHLHKEFPFSTIIKGEPFGTTSAEDMHKIIDLSFVDPDQYPTTKEGFVIMMQTGGDYEFGCNTYTPDNLRVPCFFKTEHEAQIEMADHKIMELEAFKKGDVQWDNLDFNNDEYVAWAKIFDNGNITVYGCEEGKVKGIRLETSIREMNQ